jgi:hypothetical protein
MARFLVHMLTAWRHAQTFPDLNATPWRSSLLRQHGWPFAYPGSGTEGQAMTTERMATRAEDSISMDACWTLSREQPRRVSISQRLGSIRGGSTASGLDSMTMGLKLDAAEVNLTTSMQVRQS